MNKAVLLAVILFALLSSFWMLGHSAMGNHEAYVAVASQNMLDSGNWLVPVYNGKSRLNKTPLNYWLVAAASAVKKNVSEFTTRLPNAALAAISAIAVYYFVSISAGNRIGIISALLWSSTLSFIRYSHTGRPEMSLAVFTSIAILSFYAAIEAANRKKQICFMLIFWFCFALAMLAKGPAPLPLIIPALGIYIIAAKKLKDIPKFLPVCGSLLFIAICAAWPVVIYFKSPQAIQVWQEEYFARAAGNYDAGSKPFYYYFTTIFALSAPLSGFIVPALLAPLYKIWQEKRRYMLFLLTYVFSGLVVMSFCGGKRQHYILPLIPAAVILIAIVLDDMLFVNRAYTKKFADIFLGSHLLVFLATAGFGAYMLYNGKTDLPKMLLLPLVSSVVIMLISLAAYLKNRKTVALLCFFATMAIIIIYLPCTMPKSSDGDYIIKDFASNVSACVDSKPLIAYCKVEPSFIYYCRRDIFEQHDIDKLYQAYADGTAVIAYENGIETLCNDSRFNLVFKSLDNRSALFMKK